MTTIDIRPARSEDREAIESVDSQLTAGFSERADEIAHWLRDDDVYVGLRDGRILAYAVLSNVWFGRPFIQMLMVAESSRREGIGNRLLAHLEDQVSGPELWTSTNLSNQRMQQLLASRGYQLTGFIDNLDPGDPELFYFKRL